MSRSNHFPLHTAASAPEGSRPALAATEKALGFLPNLFATVGGSPEALNGYLVLDSILAKGTFTAAERQLILERAVLRMLAKAPKSMGRARKN